MAHERIQVNFLLKRIPEYHILSSIADNIWLPAFWYEHSFKLEKTDLAGIHLSVMYVRRMKRTKEILFNF